MNGWLQVITRAEFNCTAVTQCAHRVLHLIWSTPPPSERRTY